MTLVVVAVICAAGYYVFTHPNLGQVERLAEELEGLRLQNRELANKNAQLEKKIVALRDDPRLAERRARESVGLARPGEIIFQFEEPDTMITVQVRLVVKEEKIELAGKVVALDSLDAALVNLGRDVAGAKLSVVFVGEVGAILRQRIVDVVEASPLAPADYGD
ncbi:MAG: septum formation initiator family protein [Bradymonadaceae bacterium]|nr:septum formation initiator family protein [Lujinxingiaceae bacterium]